MTFSRTGACVAAALLSVSSLQAQTNVAHTDPRWQAFLGCWATFSGGSRGQTVCLLPTESADRIEMVSVLKDSILSRTMVTASARRTPVTRAGCTGWESGTWSQDDRRLFTRAEFSCGGGATQIATGIYSMTSGEVFARVEGVKTRGASRARVVNFVWTDTVRVPNELAARMPDFVGLHMSGARVEAAADLTTADVVEATKMVDASVTEAWLADRGQPFRLAARDLRALRDAGVPSDVVDMVVAVSHPRVFAVTPGAPPGSRLPELNARGRNGLGFAEREAFERELRMLRLRGAFAYGWGDMMMPLYGSMNQWNGGFFSPFYNGFFGNGIGNPNWYNSGFQNGFGLGGVYGGGIGGGTLFGTGPYVIVPARPVQADAGRVVNGAGYSQNGGSVGDNIARPSPSVSSGGYSNGGQSSGGSASGGTAGGGAPAGGGEQRTAKPRP